jgi:opacity protein-like surface antigen
VDSTNIVGLSSPRTITNFDSDLQFTIGYRVMPNIMPYALAGVRFTDQEIKFPTISQSFLRTGWEVGGGVKSYLGEGFYGKVEVAHVDYGNKVYVGDLPVGLRALTVKVGIEKHFGKDAPAEYVRVAGAPGY